MTKYEFEDLESFLDALKEESEKRIGVKAFVGEEKDSLNVVMIAAAGTKDDYFFFQEIGEQFPKDKHAELEKAAELSLDEMIKQIQEGYPESNIFKGRVLP